MQKENSTSKALATAIQKHFKRLDETVEKCKELSKARKEYYRALNELHHGADVVFFKKYRFKKALKNATQKLQFLQNDINTNCNGYKTLEPLTIGIFGEWGSGKTHILKGVKEQIELSQQSAKELWIKTPNPDKPLTDKLIIPIFFNAWRFEKEEHIIIPLFQTMVSELEKYDYIPLVKQIKDKMKIITYSLIANLQKGDIKRLLSGDITAVASFFNFGEVFKTFKAKSKENDPNELLNNLLKSDRIESIYLNIPQWIEKITIYDNVRFLFLIDDIDRCLPENALKMLESIKLFLDVAGCSFVLAVDDDVIERGIEHHYKEYILVDGKEDDKPKYQLPITGSEYLEKIVQLPFRIPPSDSEDVRAFLIEHYKELFETKEQTKEIQQKISEVKLDETLLSFFANNIPSKPRKIKRAMMLYESKLELLKNSGISIDKLLTAKLTLLELFAPSIFRFMAQKGFISYFERANSWVEDKEIKSLSETTKIVDSIAKITIEIDRKRFKEFTKIIENIYDSRVEFNLDAIFAEKIDENSLKEHLTYKKIESKITISDEERERVSPKDRELFFERLFSDDELSWRDAFREDENIKDKQIYLDEVTTKELLEKSTLELVSNPKWLEVVATHLSNQDFLNLIAKHNPFKGSTNE